MFILKPDVPDKRKGNFVDNLRQTIGILTNSCRWVPKTAFQRNDSKRRTNQTTLTLPAVIIPLPQLRPHSPSLLNPYSSEVSSSSSSLPFITPSALSSVAVVEFESEIPEDETEIEAEECVMLDEPMGIQQFHGKGL
jgi:hypothetical protein